MNKAIRLAGGIIKIDGSKMYSPKYREHLTPGSFVSRYPKRGEDHDTLEESYQKAEKIT